MSYYWSLIAFSNCYHMVDDIKATAFSPNMHYNTVQHYSIYEQAQVVLALTASTKEESTTAKWNENNNTELKKKEKEQERWKSAAAFCRANKMSQHEVCIFTVAEVSFWI